MKKKKELIDVIQRLIKNLGFAFVIWLFGLLIFIPLTNYIPSIRSIVGFIVLIPVGLLFLRVLKDMKIFSEIAGKVLYEKKKKIGHDYRTYMHLCYAFWIIVCIVFFAPLLYFINGIIGGVFLFGAFSTLIFIVFINLKYILAAILRYLYT
ncbi:MAG: hypothetical protein U9R21_05265 [Candidatus Thermoplasmatota archaeon]|nr:hypothetical protein [Candidatus Thermoplasmatota archaeon]